MALSEREQQMLRELEQQLQSEDPGFASSLQDNSVGKLNVRNLVLGLLVTVAGIGVLIFSIHQQWIPVGVIGFLVMGAGIYLATTSSSSRGHSRGNGGGGGNSGGGGSGPGPRTSTPSPSGGKFMSSLEEKWEQKRQQP